MRLFACLILVCLTAGAAPLTEARYAHLARGINLTRWFQYGSAQPITAADRDLLVKAGFTSVRIAVAPQYLLPKWAGPETVAKNLAGLDAGIDLFLQAGIAVMLDFQADTEYLDYYLETPGAARELVETWRMLAGRYADRDPELLFFEVMNEPDSRFTQAAWDREQRQALAAIREAAPRHTVLLAPANWSGLDSLVQMTPYPDPNVIYVLHYYLPMTFTHQGATWTGSVATASLRNVPWPAFLPDLQPLIENQPDTDVRLLLQQYRDEGWDASRVDWDMRLAAAWAHKWNVKVVVNEFGDFKPYSPPESRVRWLYDVRSAIEKQHFGWAMWDYGAGFDLTVLQDGARSIDPAVSAALGLQPWTGVAPEREGPLPLFSAPRTVQIGVAPDTHGYAEGILTADVNSDGLPDLVIAPVTYPEFTENPVQLFVNAGRGIMAPGKFDGPAPTQKFVSSIVAGKFDRSGRSGFFFPDREGKSKLVMPSGAKALRDATLNLPPEIVGLQGAAAGDIDGDGVDDLVTFGERTSLLRNDGSGHFRTDPAGFANVTDQYECGAFAGADLLVFGTTAARVLNPKGGGALLPMPENSGGPVIGGCVAIADLNGDGKPDAIVAYSHDIVQVLINNGDGTFRDETAARMGPLPVSKGGLRRIALSRNTLVITRVGEAPLIRVNRGKGVFVDPGVRPGSSSWVVAPGDFNRDGYVDLVFGAGGNAPLTAWFGQAPL